MSLKQHVAAVIIFFLAMAQQSSVFAFDRLAVKPYVAGQVGAVSVNNAPFTDDSDAYQFAFGADVTPMISVEASYHAFGQYGHTVSTADSKGYSLSALARWPLLHSLGLYAKLGNLWWDSDYALRTAAPEQSTRDFYFGVGGQFQLTNQLSVKLSYDRFQIDIKREMGASEPANGVQSHLDVVAIGLVLHI